MKTTTTILILMMGIFCSNAQITLDDTNVPHSVNYTRDLDFILTAIPLPPEGPNQVYDYSGVSLPTSTFTRVYEPATRPEFSSATRFSLGQSSLGIVNLTSEFYTQKTANGIYELGSYVIPSITNLGSLTGNPSDFLEFVGNSSVFSSPSAELSFPHTFNTTSTSNYQYNTEFELTLAAFGLAATPGENIQTTVKTIETVGYGQLILPMPGGQSIPYDVLMVKRQRVATNNIFLGGAPAPQALLDAFGITQGQVETISEYLFYTENYETPILTVIMNEDFTVVDQMSYDMDILQLDTNMSVDDNEFSSNFKIYPNPASQHVLISQELNLTSDMQIVIYDVFGKVVKEIKSDTNNNFNSELKIDVNDLSNGTYFLKINADENSTTKKLMINK